MIPADLHDFLIATVTTSASFIGLLFVAISFVMNDEKDSQADAQTKRILAESSYAALLWFAMNQQKTSYKLWWSWRSTALRVRRFILVSRLQV